MRSVKVHWVLGFKQKQRSSEEVFWNVIHIQTYTWTKYAFCESTLSGGPQGEAMGFRIFSKHYTHSNIQFINVCALWKCTEWWDSSRSNGSQKKFFETLYTYKHTIEQSMRSVKVHWVVGFKLKQWVSEEVFQNVIPIHAYNWTMYALCKSTLSVGLQAEVRAFRRSFSEHYTYPNIQSNKKCALWRYTGEWASSRSSGFQKKFFKTLYILKHTIQQCVHSVIVHWVVGFKQKNNNIGADRSSQTLNDFDCYDLDLYRVPEELQIIFNIPDFLRHIILRKRVKIIPHSCECKKHWNV